MLSALVLVLTTLSLPDGYWKFTWKWDDASGLTSEVGVIRALHLEGQWRDDSNVMGFEGYVDGDVYSFPVHASCFRNSARGITCTVFAKDGARKFMFTATGVSYLCEVTQDVCWITDSFEKEQGS